MKWLLLAIAPLVVLTGCSGGESQAAPEVVTVTTTPPAAPTASPASSEPPGLTIKQACGQVAVIWPEEFDAPIGAQWDTWISDLESIQGKADPEGRELLEPAIALMRRAGEAGSDADQFTRALQLATRGFRQLNDLCFR